MTDITIAKADPGDARPLLEASHAMMRALYDPDDCHVLSIDALRAPGITFLVARDAGGAVLGCGALAARDGFGEVKSMFTADAARGRGVAAALLDAIEARARAAGLPRLCLETGQELAAAVRLYHRKGFVECGPFGGYTAEGASYFMEKPLV